MIEAFVLTTGWLFWIFVGVIVVFDVIALSTEDEGMFGWAIFMTMAGLIAAFAFTDAFLGVKLLWLAVGIFAYCLIGVLWSFKKWIDYVIYYKEQYPNNKDRRPTAAGNKTRIIASMALWPFQATWWVLTWPRHFFAWAYRRLSTVYDRITDKIWEG